MHQIRLDDQLYQAVERRAAAAGFDSVETYVANVLQHDLAASENLDQLFTAERLALITKAEDSIAAGHGLSAAEVDAELARRIDG